jgi:hypothetical protein
MLKTALLLLAFSSLATAQEKPTIKAHAIGERLSEFKAKEPKVVLRNWDYDGNTIIDKSNRVAFDLLAGQKLRPVCAIFRK